MSGPHEDGHAEAQGTGALQGQGSHMPDLGDIVTQASSTEAPLPPYTLTASQAGSAVLKGCALDLHPVETVSSHHSSCSLPLSPCHYSSRILRNKSQE